MNIEMISILLIVAAVAAMILRHKFRHVFIVPEGYAGLLYQHGKFVAQLGVGRNIRWGRGFTLAHQDLRKAILAGDRTGSPDGRQRQPEGQPVGELPGR